MKTTNPSRMFYKSLVIAAMIFAGCDTAYSPASNESDSDNSNTNSGVATTDGCPLITSKLETSNLDTLIIIEATFENNSVQVWQGALDISYQTTNTNNTIERVVLFNEQVRIGPDFGRVISLYHKKPDIAVSFEYSAKAMGKNSALGSCLSGQALASGPTSTSNSLKPVLQ